MAYYHQPADPDRWICCRCRKENTRDEQRCENLKSGGGLSLNLGMVGVGGNKEGRKCGHLNCSTGCIRGWLNVGMGGGSQTLPPFLQQQGYGGRVPTPPTQQYYSHPSAGMPPGFAEPSYYLDDDEDNYRPVPSPVFAMKTPGQGLDPEGEALLKMMAMHRGPLTQSSPQQARASQQKPSPPIKTLSLNDPPLTTKDLIPKGAATQPWGRKSCDDQENRFDFLAHKPISKKVLSEWSEFLTGFVASYKTRRDEIIGNPKWVSEKVITSIQNVIAGVVNFREDYCELATLMFKTFAIVIRQTRNVTFIDNEVFAESAVASVNRWPESAEICAAAFWAVRNASAAIDEEKVEPLDCQTICNALAVSIENHGTNPMVITELVMTFYNLLGKWNGTEKQKQQICKMFSQLKHTSLPHQHFKDIDLALARATQKSARSGR